MDRHCFLDVVRITGRRLDRVSRAGVLAGPCPAGIISSGPHPRNSAEYVASHRGRVSGKEFHCAALAALWSLRIGTILMPVGFLLGGIWHYESDPGTLIFFAPVGGLMIILGVLAIAVSTFKK